MSGMKLLLQRIGVILCAMIEAPLALTASPIGNRRVRSAKPQVSAAKGGARGPHAPPQASPADALFRRVTWWFRRRVPPLRSPLHFLPYSGLRCWIQVQELNFPDRAVLFGHCLLMCLPLKVVGYFSMSLKWCVDALGHVLGWLQILICNFSSILLLPGCCGSWFLSILEAYVYLEFQ